MIADMAKKSKWAKDLKALRISKGLTQEEVRKLLDISLATYRNWEQGRTTPAPFVRRCIERLISGQ